jgi:hypothetical protein
MKTNLPVYTSVFPKGVEIVFFLRDGNFTARNAVPPMIPNI